MCDASMIQMFGAVVGAVSSGRSKFETPAQTDSRKQATKASTGSLLGSAPRYSNTMTSGTGGVASGAESIGKNTLLGQ